MPGAATLKLLPSRWFGAVQDQTLLAVPFFVLMGAILEKSGLAERLLNTIGMLMGPIRGGVAAAVVIVGTLLAAATGVVAATVIVMGLLSLPTMLRLGYDHNLATGAIFIIPHSRKELVLKCCKIVRKKNIIFLN